MKPVSKKRNTKEYIDSTKRKVEKGFLSKSWTMATKDDKSIRDNYSKKYLKKEVE